MLCVFSYHPFDCQHGLFSGSRLSQTPVEALHIGPQILTIAEIQGPAFQSPYVNQTVSVTGLVTAKGPSGFWLAGEPSGDVRVSNGILVFSSSATVLGNVSVGSEVSLNARVSEYRSSTRPDDLFLTELTSPTNITTISSNNTVTPIVLGRDRSPPTELFSALDEGPDGFLSVPNAVNKIESQNATLQPDKYGLDFWESLEGQLVTIPQPFALNFENQYQEFWVRGAWPVTGLNKRGGLTITAKGTGAPDGNPEVVIIGSPLDGTKNPDTAAGFGLSDITGVVTYQFGFYYVLPLTAPTIISRPDPEVPPTSLTAPKKIPIIDLLTRCIYTFGDYNVENLSPKSAHLPTIADHIAKFLKTPDLVFLQEIQDNTGATDDGVVSANQTLSALASAVYTATGVNYSFVDIAPVNNQDGGAPGGNIRTAYFYRPERISLEKGAPIGGSLDAVAVKKAGILFKHPSLTLNPGRLEPTNVAWNASRKPLVAEWKTAYGDRLFTINVHFASKGGSGSTQGNSRPPTNGGVGQRAQQVKLVADFVNAIYAIDKQANIIISGDFNEFFQARSVYAPLEPLVVEVDEVANVPDLDRYTYVFDQNHQQLDHMFVSHAIAKRKVEVEHVHINNWAPKYEERTSDHDPSVARLRVC